MLPITGAIAAISALMLVALSLNVSLGRIKAGVTFGFGNDEHLMRRIRAQANFTEYVPLALILIGLAEYRGAAPAALWIIALLLAAGRACHAAGILAALMPLRAAGMLGTYAALVGGAAMIAFG